MGHDRLGAAPTRRFRTCASHRAAPGGRRSVESARHSPPPQGNLPPLRAPCSRSRLFKAYDIRGVVGRNIDEAFAEHLGRAFGSEALAAGERAVAVGRDGRLSGPALVAALIRGLVSTGLDVVDLGAVTTPMLYYVAATRGDMAAAAASRSPAATTRRTTTASRWCSPAARSTATTSSACASASRPRTTRRAPGRSATMDIARRVPPRIVGDCKLARPMKIVVDSGNGIPGATAPGILRALGCEVIDAVLEVDGDFPNHHPDPSKPENLADLIKVVHATGAELGLAFDGDGDRLGVVTRDGHIIYPDRQLMLFARDVLSRHPGAPIIFDVKCSQRLPVAIREAGGVPLMWKTGHSLIKAKLKETGAPLAGEMSGHIFFGERWYGFDDAMYTAARLLEILSRSDDPSAVLDALPTSSRTPELNVACAEGEPHGWWPHCRRSRPTFAGADDHHHRRPARRYADGFGLVRASNTTPVLVLRFEGHTPGGAAPHRAQFMAALRAVKPDAQVGTGRALSALQRSALPGARAAAVAGAGAVCLRDAAAAGHAAVPAAAVAARRQRAASTACAGRAAGLLSPATPLPGALWLHAVSLGETRAALPLVEALRAAAPGCGCC